MNRSWPARVGALVVVVAVAGPRAAGGQEPTRATQVPVNGIELYYEEYGAGPPLVLLHWFGSCGQIWQPHRERLAQHYRLIIPDLPGHGRSTGPNGRFTHSQAARDVFVLLDSLGIRRFDAIGLSSGGMTLIHMATQQSARIDALVLVGATTYFPAQARAIMEQSVPERLSEEDLAEWGRCSARGDTQTRAVLSQFYEMKDSYDDMNFTGPYLSTITARTLIVHGDRDEFFPVSIPVQMYESIPRSYLWIVARGGHIPIFGERAPVFQEEVLGFLRGDWERR